MSYLLHIHHPSGAVQTVPFATAFVRALAMISLAAQPVLLRLEDVS